jgi:hypothetical protein
MMKIIFSSLLCISILSSAQRMDSLKGMVKRDCDKSGNHKIIKGKVNGRNSNSFTLGTHGGKEYFIKIDPEFLNQANDAQRATLLHLLYSGHHLKVKAYVCGGEYYADEIQERRE